MDKMKLPLKKKETGRIVTGFLLYSREKITLFSYRLSRHKIGPVRSVFFT